MKTLKISDHLHTKLTTILGQLMEESEKSKTYEDVIEALVGKAAVLPPELLLEIDKFITEKKELGYITKEEFLKDAARYRLDQLRKNPEKKL